jgi:acetolactate synthase II small subunit
VTHALDLELQHTEGILIRVLGLTERRGFLPVTVSIWPSGNGTVALSMTVYSERPVELLLRQLAKLLDVNNITLVSQSLQQAAK